MNDLDVTGAEKSFGRTRVLHGVDLAVPDSSPGALLGPSGCRKTTLLRLVAGFERLDPGTIRTGGRVLARGRTNHVRPERRGVGVVPQEGALFPHLSVARNVAFGLRRHSRAERRRRTAEVLELVGLTGYADRMPHELSGGQQQRVALARALAPEPALVLLDEPFNALDPALRSGLREEVRQVLHTAGVTALLVTHDPEEALSTADGIPSKAARPCGGARLRRPATAVGRSCWPCALAASPVKKATSPKTRIRTRAPTAGAG